MRIPANFEKTREFGITKIERTRVGIFYSFFKTEQKAKNFFFEKKEPKSYYKQFKGRSIKTTNGWQPGQRDNRERGPGDVGPRRGRRGTIAIGVGPFMRRPAGQDNGGIALRDRAGRTRPTESGRGQEDRLKAGP